MLCAETLTLGWTMLRLAWLRPLADCMAFCWEKLAERVSGMNGLTIVDVSLVAHVLRGHAFAESIGLGRGGVVGRQAGHTFLLGLNYVLQLREELATVNLGVSLLLLAVCARVLVQERAAQFVARVVELAQVSI